MLQQQREYPGHCIVHVGNVFATMYSFTLDRVPRKVQLFRISQKMPLIDNGMEYDSREWKTCYDETISISAST